MDSATRCRLKRLGRRIDVLGVGSRQRTNGRFLHDTGDGFNRLEVTLTGNRKAGFHDIDTQTFQGLTDTDLLVFGHRCAGRLLTVTHRGVKNH